MEMTMIGSSGCGKTCYLYATYVYMLDGVCGFSFFPSDWNQGLELERGWDSICTDATWPLGTDANSDTEYNFGVLLNGTKIGSFSWLDYRGGILNSTVNKESPNDVTRFHNRCSKTDSFLVAIPADTLLKSDEGDQRAISIIRRYQVLLNYFPNIQNKPVSLVITKGDLIPNRESMQRCISLFKKKFGTLFSERHKSLMVCRVSLGRFDGEMVQGGKFEGVIRPLRLHIPILFPLWYELSRLARQYQSESEKYQKAADSIWDELVRNNVHIYSKGRCLL